MSRVRLQRREKDVPYEVSVISELRGVVDSLHKIAEEHKNTIDKLQEENTYLAKRGSGDLNGLHGIKDRIDELLMDGESGLKGILSFSGVEFDIEGSVFKKGEIKGTYKVTIELSAVISRGGLVALQDDRSKKVRLITCQEYD